MKVSRDLESETSPVCPLGGGWAMTLDGLGALQALSSLQVLDGFSNIKS